MSQVIDAASKVPLDEIVAVVSSGRENYALDLKSGKRVHCTREAYARALELRRFSAELKREGNSLQSSEGK
jgi:hypothetical protein